MTQQFRAGGYETRPEQAFPPLYHPMHDDGYHVMTVRGLASASCAQAPRSKCSLEHLQSRAAQLGLENLQSTLRSWGKLTKVTVGFSPCQFRHLATKQIVARGPKQWSTLLVQPARLNTTNSWISIPMQQVC